jgi:hypothetical protein
MDPEQLHYWFKAQNRRAGNLRTWWICALCTRSFGKRGLLSGNLSSKYCKVRAPLSTSPRQPWKMESLDRKTNARYMT